MSIAVGGGFRGVQVGGSNGSGGSGGSGDVVGPASSTNSYVAVFTGTDGKHIMDGGALPSVAGMVVGPTSATNGHLAVFDQTTGKLIKDGGAVPSTAGLVVGAASVTDGHLAVFDQTGYAIKDGGAVPNAGDVYAPASATQGHLAVFGSTPTQLSDGGAVPAAGSTVYAGATQLSGGSAYIPCTHITANSIIMATYGPNTQNMGVSDFDSMHAGFLDVAGRSAGNGFNIRSELAGALNTADDNYVMWMLTEPNNP